MYDQDKVYGVLLGLAAGDKIGGPIHMALELAESLLEQKAFHPEAIFTRYQSWWNKDGFDTGPIAEQVIQLVNDGIPIAMAAKKVDNFMNGMTAGCNPAHRCAPLALFGNLNDDALPEAAKQEARLTHWNQVAGDVSAAVVILYRALISGASWNESLDRAKAQRLELTQRAFILNDKNNLNSGGFAPEVLKAALYFVNHTDNFSQALDRSIQFAGPSNYCPVLAGAIGGARWGVGEIPEKAFSHHKALLPRIKRIQQAFIE